MLKFISISNKDSFEESLLKEFDISSGK
jgi:hypothetical protein